MSSKFEIYTDAKGSYRFRLKAGNGQIIATGQGYKTKEGCLNGIESIRKNSPLAEIVELETE
ncbi:YegP family protein [Clostridium sp. DL1XJH146]